MIMGCDLIYSSRKLTQLRTGGDRVCHLWYVAADGEKSRAPVSIRLALGPNLWNNSYLFPPSGSFDLLWNTYYWVSGADIRYFFVDSNGDAWFFKSRIDFEAAISKYFRLGPSFHLSGAIHYSQLNLPNKTDLIPSRYARILLRMRVTETPPQEESEGVSSPVPYDPIQNILDFEFNKPKPVPLKNHYDLDFEAIAREAIEED